MSGWLVIRSMDDGVPDTTGWTAALRTIPAGCAAVTWSGAAGTLAGAAWRRKAGEYQHSGRLVSSGPAARCVAWVGTCLEDSGERTREVLGALSGAQPAAVDAASLNGEFAAAVLDPYDGSLSVWTDRHAHYPIFTWQDERAFVASTCLESVIPFVDRPRADRKALDLFVRCGELIDDLTHIEGIRCLPGGMHLNVGATGGVRTQRYWRMHHGRPSPLSERSALEELTTALPRAVRRIEDAYPRLVVPLSGGLDSRLLLGLCTNPQVVPSVTWGTRGCRDLRYAKSFAERIGSPHTSYDFSPDAYVPLWPRGVAASNGCLPIRDMFVLPFVDGLAQSADVMLNGLAGDALIGGSFVMGNWLKIQDMEALADTTWRWRVRPDEDIWADKVLCNSDTLGEGRWSWRRSVCATEGFCAIDRLVDWLFENRVFRFTNCGTQLFRTRMESYSPFFDRDVLDILLCVPLASRYKHRLYMKLLPRVCPPAAAVPWQRTGIPPAWGYSANLASMAAHKGLRLAGKVFGWRAFRSQAVASPAEWFRGPWAAPARSVLLSSRTLDRGLFRPKATADLLSAHMAGEDHSRMLSSLLAAEMFYRHHLDGDATAGVQGQSPHSTRKTE